MSPDDESGRGRLVRSSAVVATGTLLSRVTGLLRVVVLAAAIGKATLADTYNLANTTPNIVYELLVGGVLAATVVPVFVDELERRNYRSISAVFTTTMTALVIFTAATMAFTPLLARLFAIGSHGAERSAQLHVLTLFILCFVPQMIFYGFTTLATALLNARRRFVAAAYAPVLNNVVVIAVVLVFIARTSGRTGISDAVHVRNDLGLLLLLGIGTTAGIVAMAVVLVPAISRSGVHLEPVFAWRDAAVRHIVRLSGWTAGYVVANQIAQFFILVLAKSHGVGNASAYTYAFMFYVLPHGLLAVSIMTTMTPELARRVSAGDARGFRRDFRLGLRFIIVLTVPASVLFAVLAQPMLGVIVRYQFTRVDAAITADTLQCFALSLVPFSLYLYAMRAFYAHHNTRTPFLLNLVENLCNILFALVLFPALGVQGLALAWGGAYLVGAVAAFVSLRQRHGTIFDVRVRGAISRAVIAGAALALVAAPVAGVIGHATAARAFVATVVAGAVGGVVYFVVLVTLRSPELGHLRETLRNRRGTPAEV